MKRTVLLLLVLCLTVPFGVWAKKKHANAPARDAQFSGWQKLDSSARELWMEYKKRDSKEDDEGETVELMVRTNTPVKKKESVVLKVIGLRYRTVVPYKNRGSILTASMPIRHLDELAAVDFVDYIEAAKPLSIKPDAKAPVNKAVR